jgi:hypothetical protein
MAAPSPSAKARLEAGVRRASPRHLEQARGRIHADHARVPRRRQQRRVARAGAEVEHPLAGLRRGRLDHDARDRRQLGAVSS